jgi:hypothetical protein
MRGRTLSRVDMTRIDLLAETVEHDCPRMMKSGLIVVAMAFALAGATGASSGPPAVQLDTHLPSWLAPGVSLAVSGTGDPGTVIAVGRVPTQSFRRPQVRTVASRFTPCSRAPARTE